MGRFVCAASHASDGIALVPDIESADTKIPWHRMTGVLDYENVTKDYGVAWSRQRVRALDGFSLSLERGEIFGFLGPNGAGKTTAIHLALGFMRPSSGAGQTAWQAVWRCAHAGQGGISGGECRSLSSSRPTTAALLRRAESACVPQRAKLRCREVLRQVELATEANRNVGKFSRGMQQRIGLGAGADQRSGVADSRRADFGARSPGAGRDARAFAGGQSRRENHLSELTSAVRDRVDLSSRRHPEQGAAGKGRRAQRTCWCHVTVMR